MREKVKMKRRWNCVLLFWLYLFEVDSSAVLSHCPSELLFNQSLAVSSMAQDVLTNLCSLSLRPSNPNHTLIVFEARHYSLHNNTVHILLDGKRVDFSKQCSIASCFLFGNHLEVIFNSSLFDFGSELNWAIFQIGYEVVENTCPTPQAPINGKIIEHGSKLGEKMIFSCDLPFIMSSGSLKSESFCLVSEFNNTDVPKPSWNASVPSCIIPQCSRTPFRVKIGESEEAMIVNPSYPKAFKWKKNRLTCSWVVELEDSEKILRVLIESAFVEGENNSLMFYDGEIESKNLILRANGILENIILSPINNRLTIRLELNNFSALFTIRVWASRRVCSLPLPPSNGLVQGGIIEEPKNRDQQVVAYSCDKGFYLNGNELSFCSSKGEWNSSTPQCLSYISEPPFFDSSNPNLSIFNVPKNQRPSPPQQSTEEKGRHWKILVTSGDYSNFTDYSPAGFDEYPDKDAELVSIYDSGVTFADEEIKEEFPVGASIALGVGIPVAVGILGLVAFLMYRKLYPARMTIGRKFGTFENPVYEGSKRNPGRTDSLLPNSSLIQVPPELQRLTTHGHR